MEYDDTPLDRNCVTIAAQFSNISHCKDFFAIIIGSYLAGLVMLKRTRAIRDSQDLCQHEVSMRNVSAIISLWHWYSVFSTLGRGYRREAYATIR